MCGIIGSVNVEWGKSPLNSIKHRGPDFHSEFVIDNLYLGHTRLSIQDTSAKGNQPMIKKARYVWSLGHDSTP